MTDTVQSDIQTREHFAHEAVFYDGAAQHAPAVLPFIRAGVEAGEPVLVALLPDAVSEVRDELGDAARSVSFLDMSDLGANPARIIPAWRQFLADRGHSGPVRGVGEPAWPGRRPVELAEAALHEGLLNVAFDDGPAWRLLCPYDAQALPADVIAEARRTHPSVNWPVTDTDGMDYGGHDYSQRAFGTELPPPPLEATRIDFDADDLTALRSVVRRVAAVARLDQDAGDDLVLAAHELAMNSVQHGGGGGTLLIWQDHDALVLEIRDPGWIDDLMIGRTMPGLDSVSGRGIWMANQLCSLVQVRSGHAGTQVRLHSWL